MYYIFEDKQDDVTSKLFRQAYKNDFTDKYFLYTDGNGMLISTAEEKLADGISTVAVFLDLIPGNESCVRIYKGLRSLARMKANKNRLFVFPILCLEYYIILSLVHGCLIEYNTDIGIALNKGDYTKSQIYAESFDEDGIRNKCRTFERYCKYVLKKYPKDCCKHTRGKNKENKQYGWYYEQDCRCNDCSCRYNLLNKALLLLKEYYCVPGNTQCSNKSSISLDEAKRISNRMVDEYNEMCCQYENWSLQGKTYATVRKIYEEVG